MISAREDYYKDYILSNMPRVLTQVDRDRDSKTYGSCDRNYWHLKIRDFSSAILQQTSLTLALAYKVNFTGNIYYGNENVREWAAAALRYLEKIQLRDGSFNEYYPHEHSYPATAFVLFAGCRTYVELGLNDTSVLETLRKAAYWLAKHQEKKAYNQEWASIAGIYEYAELTGDKEISVLLEEKIENALAAQSKDGWFPEQGGADIGYSSVALDMLSEYYRMSGDVRVKEPLNKLVHFLQYFIHPDGTAGGEYGSRNTLYFMPAGMEFAAHMSGSEAAAAVSVIDKLYGESGRTCSGNFMDAVDERYLSHYVLHSYLRALQRCGGQTPQAAKLPCETEHEMIFQDAALMAKCKGCCYFVFSARKGGVLKIYHDGRELAWDCGYRVRMADGKVAATNWLDDSYLVEWRDDGCTVEGKMNLVSQKVQSPIYLLGLHIAAFVLGERVNKLIKKLTIFSDKHTDIRFRREVTWGARDLDMIEVRDMITSAKQILVEEAPNCSLRLVASGKFFSRSDLLVRKPGVYEVDGGVITIQKKYDLSGSITDSSSVEKRT